MSHQLTLLALWLSGCLTPPFDAEGKACSESDPCPAPMMCLAVETGQRCLSEAPPQAQDCPEGVACPAGHRCSVDERSRRVCLPEAEAPAEGLLAQYFATRDLIPLAEERVEAPVDFTWPDGKPEAPVGPEEFSVRWRGYVLPPVSGSWTFITESNDGVRLWVDNVPLIDRWTTRATLEDQGSIELDASKAYAVTLEYFQSGGSATIRLLWEGPETVKQVIRRERLVAR